MLPAMHSYWLCVVVVLAHVGQAVYQRTGQEDAHPKRTRLWPKWMRVEHGIL